MPSPQAETLGEKANRLCGCLTDAIVLPVATVSAAKENVYIVGTASKPSQYPRRAETEGR
jgi:hypothetical protein